MWRGGRGTYYIKGVTVRFGFDVLESRKFKLLVKNKATGTPHGMYVYNPYWLLSIEQKSIGYIIFISVGLSALLVSTNRAMREP